MERRKLGRLVKEKKVKLGTTKRRKLGRLVKKKESKVGNISTYVFYCFKLFKLYTNIQPTNHNKSYKTLDDHVLTMTNALDAI